MSRGLLVGLGIVAALAFLVLVVGGWFVATRNGLVAAEEQVNSAWAQVENVYQRRADLVPNLVETVRGYAAHERETFDAVTDARSRVGSIQMTPEALSDPAAVERFQALQGSLTTALSRLLAVAENYPNLKANESFLTLQSQLEGTENRIAVERNRFNETARAYNTRIRQFPGSIVASMSGFQSKAYFEAAAGAETAPKVEFGR
jgi:LemA protein